MAKKSLKYFLLLFFALILSVLPPPGDVHATGAGSAITTDVRYGIASQTSSMVGQGEQYLVTNTLSGTTSTLYSPFSYVYLDKNIFVTPVVSDVTLEAGAVNASIIYSDPNYYIIKIDYSRLDTGYAAVPVKATLKNSAVQNGETFHIPVKLFEAGKNPATDAPLASSNDQFVAKAYPVGIISPDTSAVANNNRKSEYISDEATNAAHDRLSTDFVSTLSGFGYSGPSNTANGGVTMVPAGQGAGMDKRKVQFKITLPATAVWDPSLPNNAGWTYNSADRTITQTVDRGLATIVQPPFSLKWDGNQPVTLAPTWTKITMQQVTTLVNDDGTLDNSTRRSGEIYYHVSYVRRIRIRKTLLGEGGYLVPRDADYKYNYLVSVDQFGGTRPQTASSVTFRMIEDEPQARSLLTGYELRVRPERFTATELAKLSHNKLVGSDNGTTWTPIATNITPVQVSNATDYRANSVSTTLTTPPEYRYFRLVFDDDITISQFDEDAVGFIVQTQLTPATHTAYINDLNARVNDVYSKLVRNYGRVKNAAGQELGYSNADAYISNPYASLSLTNFGMQINNNGSTTVVSTGGTITINPRINYNSLLWDPRTANNARMVIVADSDLAFDSASFTTNANYFTSMDTTPIVVQNYKGNVGKTAYIFPINNLTFPGSVYNNYGNRQINRADFTRFLFKPTSGMDGGPHEIKAILSWDNNTTAASSAAPGVVYSSDNKNDPYDANDNGNTNDRLPTLTYNYTFVPPQAMVLGKKVKLSTESVYQTKMKADKGDILDYQVRVWNNTNDPVQDLHVIDVFPYAGDKFIVKDGSGVYHDRGSKIYPKAISGVTVNNSKFDVYYSTDNPSDNINGNVNATWVPASSISDWSAVKMFKADLKSGQSVVANEEVTFNYKVEMPDTKDNAATDTANNSVASWRGNNLDGANEFTDSQVGTHKYNIATHAFYDLNGNGVYDSTDLNITNRPYVLVKLDASGTENVVEAGRTDANGNISFTNKLSNEGNYKLYVENLTSDSFAVPNVPSSAAVIGNDFTSFVTRASVLNADQTPIPNSPWSSVAINLTRDNPTAIKNLGLKTDFYNLTVKHIKDEDGSNLVLDVTTREPRDTRYTTAPITTDPDFEVDTANLPANASGSYTADTTVTYHYVRRNAGDVTVHHYETGTTTELYATSSTATPAAEVLSGARQMGKPYQTYRRDISTAGSYAIPHYHLVGTPQGPTSGTFDATAKTVTYYYERNTSPDVTIKYIDIDTGENLTRPESLGSSTMVNTPTVLSGANKEGLAWSSSQLPVDNYDFISSSTPTSGVFGDGTTTVTYSYRRKNAGNITVHHYERGTTTELYSPTVGATPGPEVIDGTRKLGLTYQSQDRSAQIMNYHLYQAPSPTLLTFTTAPQEISYYYERDNGSSITIHYIDDGTGNELYSAIPGGTPSAVVLDGTNKLGLTYTTQSKTFPHFHLVSSPVNPVVTFGNTPVEVYYRYRRDDAGDVKVHYLEDGTNVTLSPDEFFSGAEKSGLTYSTSAKSIQFYTVVNAQPTDYTGIYPASGLREITYYYRRDDAGNVTVHHYETGTTNSLLPDEYLPGAGKAGLSYSTNPGSVQYYSVIDVHPNGYADIYPTNGNREVTYYYRRDDAGDVLVHHVEAGTGNTLAPDEFFSGTSKSGLPYTTNPLSITNFTVVNPTPANNTGTFTPGVNYVITYEYKRDDAGDITANYYDTHGNRIETTEVLPGANKLGLPYTTPQKNIRYYDLVAVPNNANGVFGTSDITVDYIYKRQDAGNVIIRYLDEDGNTELANTVVLNGSEQIGMPYTSEVKSFDYYDLISMPNNANGVFDPGTQRVDYIYRRKNAGNVIAHYINSAGFPIESDEFFDGTRKLGLPYETSEKYIPGYHLDLVSGIPSGIFGENQVEITYIYVKDPSVVITPGAENVKLATPSTIVDPRDPSSDFTIRPRATSSIATRSNSSRGGSGGDSTVRPAKATVVNNNDVKSQIDKPELNNPEIPLIIIDKPKADVNTKSTRKALSVPKTSDSRNTFGYFILLIISCGSIVLLRRKEK
jgi:cell wall surface anchor family protein